MLSLSHVLLARWPPGKDLQSFWSLPTISEFSRLCNHDDLATQRPAPTDQLHFVELNHALTDSCLREFQDKPNKSQDSCVDNHPALIFEIQHLSTPLLPGCLSLGRSALQLLNLHQRCTLATRIHKRVEWH